MMYSSDGQRLFSLFVNMSCSSVDSLIYVALSFVFVVVFHFFLPQIITEKGKKNIARWLNFQTILPKENCKSNKSFMPLLNVVCNETNLNTDTC